MIINIVPNYLLEKSKEFWNNYEWPIIRKEEKDMNETKRKYRAKCNKMTLEFYLHEEELFNWVKKHLTPKQIKYMLATYKEKYEAHTPTQQEREALFEEGK